MTDLPSGRAPSNPAPSGAGFFVWSIAAALLASAPLGAAAEPPRAAGAIGVGAVLFDLVERGPTGAVLDSEEGVLPSASAAVELDLSRWLLGAEAELAGGRLGYDGRTRSSSVALDDLPVATRTDARLLRIGASIGRWLDRGRTFAVVAGGAWRRWDRRIRPATAATAGGVPVAVAGLDERYRIFDLAAGVRLAPLRTGRAEARLEVRAELPVDLSLAVDTPAGEVRLRPRARLGWRVALPLLVTLRGRTFVAVEPYAAERRLGASAADRASHIYEPASETRTLGVDARLGIRL